MRSTTLQQLNKLRELESNTVLKSDSQLRALFSHFLQILKDIDPLSQFSSDFSMKLIRFDFQSDKSNIREELIELMKSSINYYSDM